MRLDLSSRSFLILVFASLSILVIPGFILGGGFWAECGSATYPLDSCSHVTILSDVFTCHNTAIWNTIDECIAPSPTISSVGGDITTPYWDTSNDDNTDIVISGESGMSCRWSNFDWSYLDMVFDCTVVGSVATCTLSGFAEGTYVKYVACKDSAENQQTNADNLHVTFGIDWTAPTTTISKSGTPGDNGWYKTDVTVTLTCDDGTGSGCESTNYRIDGGAWTAYSAAFTITTGTHIVDYYSTDNAGNTEATETATIKIDKVAPTTTISKSGTPGDNGWYKTDVTVTLTCTDATSGCASIKYRIDAGEWTTYSAAFTITTGTHTVDYYSIDAAGNQETQKTDTTKVDKVAPATTDNAPSAWQSSDVTVTLTCTDATSGCASTKYCVYNSGDAQCTPTTTGTSVSVTCPDNTVCQKIVRYYSTDSAGNTETTHDSPTISIDKHCEFVSASIARSASCASDVNNCANSGTSCNGGNTVSVTATYKGLACPSSINVQVDASGGSCSVAGSGATMTGISVSCTNTPSADPQTCTGTWTLQGSVPNVVPPTCQGITIAASTEACGASINGLYCKQPTGSFSTCRDLTNTVQTAITLNSGDTYSASKTVTATALSGKDTTYSLTQCVLDWGDGSTTTKACDAGAGVECANKFSATEKQHAYATNGAKIATITCTNVNSVTGSGNDGITVDDTTPDIVAINAYTDSSRTTPISNGVWQSDSTPYFTWTDPNSPSDNRFYYTYNSDPPDPTSTSSFTSNPYLDGLTFTDGTHVTKARPWTFAGTFGTTRSFTLKVDTVTPTTTDNSDTSWHNSDVTITLLCSDATSGCGAKYYCTDTTGTCTTDTTYTSPITFTSSGYIRYWSYDNAGNQESRKTSNQIKIDKDKPSSSVGALPARTKPASGGFTVSWSGSDSGSGVNNYRIEYKDGATGVWTTCVSQLSPVSVNFGPGCTTPLTLQDGHTYYFRSIAEDNAGNFENAPADYDAYTLADMSAPAGFDVLADKEYLQWVAPSFRIYTPTAITADDVVSCEYTTDSSTWNAATWNGTSRTCEKTGLTCSDGQSLTINMRVTDSVGNVGSGLSITRVCDNSVPIINSITPAFGTRIYIGSLNPAFSIFTTDGKSGLALAEWELFSKGKTETSYTSKGVSQKACDGTPGATVPCTFTPTNIMVGGDPYHLNDGDTAYVKVKTADHLDNWSPLTQSGEIVANINAPQISAIYPTFMKLGQAQKYKADVEPKEGLEVTSCDLYVNNVLKGAMTQVSGNMTSGAGAWESASQTLTTPGIYFMRARCGDDGGNVGDGPETLISVGTSTTGVIKPASAEKYETINANATYVDNADSPNKITGATCSITDTNFIGPRTIKGKIFRELGDGIYTSGFEAPGKSGDYYYVVSCSKFGYQTTSDRKDFTVLGCVGSQCVDVTPPESLMIFTVGETQSIDLVLRNRGDDSRTYSVTLSGNTINIHTQISPAQLTIPAGQTDVARITMTAVAFTSDQMLQNIAVTNIGNAADTDSSLVRVSIALSSLPDVSMLGIAFMAVLAAAALFFRKR